MSDDLSLTNQQKKPFEVIKQHASDGSEYWSARDLMVLLGYEDNWDNFEKVVRKAIQSAETSNVISDTNVAFRKATKSYKSSNRYGEFTSEKTDYHLSRFASFLIAQNGDPAKPQIALAQAYFTIQTFRQEQLQNMSEAERRLYIRSQVTSENKKLHKAAQESGVYRFGTFYDAGYIGLYGMSAAQIKRHKGLGKDNILDRAGSTELAANLFRITQTQERLQTRLEKGEHIGDLAASRTHFMVGGKVRQTIKDIGGKMPELLDPEAESVKQLEKRLKVENKRVIESAEKPLKIKGSLGDTLGKIAKAPKPKK
jgi:DNA-damage-inducible protein D